MAALLFYPAIPDRNTFYDQLFRVVWHFVPMVKKIDRMIFLYSGNDHRDIDVDEILNQSARFLPKDCDPMIADFAPRFSGKTQLLDAITLPPEISDLQGVIVWDTTQSATVGQAQQIAKDSEAEAVLADPNRTQQETLKSIRFAYSLWTQEELNSLVETSYARFLSLNELLPGNRTLT